MLCDGTQKLGYTGGDYMNMNGHYTQVYGGQALLPAYPLYQINQTHAMGLPAAHIYSPAAAARMVTGPPLLSKPTSFLPNSGIKYHTKIVAHSSVCILIPSKVVIIGIM